MVIFNEEELRRIAPAAFATEPEKGKVSDRYEFLPTTTILEMLQEEGWRWNSANQVNSRTWSGDHAKHIIRLRHIGFEREQVVDASRKVIMNAANMADKIGTWQEIDLSDRSRKDFFADAARLRFGDSADDDIIRAVSQPRREADRGTDLWRTFNVAQENVLRGGFLREKTKRKVREVTNINTSISLNQELWDLAATYAN